MCLNRTVHLVLSSYCCSPHSQHGFCFVKNTEANMSRKEEKKPSIVMVLTEESSWFSLLLSC